MTKSSSELALKEELLNVIQQNETLNSLNLEEIESIKLDCEPIIDMDNYISVTISCKNKQVAKKLEIYAEHEDKNNDKKEELDAYSEDKEENNKYVINFNLPIKRKEKEGTHTIVLINSIMDIIKEDIIDDNEKKKYRKMLHLLIFGVGSEMATSLLQGTDKITLTAKDLYIIVNNMSNFLAEQFKAKITMFPEQIRYILCNVITILMQDQHFLEKVQLKNSDVTFYMDTNTEERMMHCGFGVETNIKKTYEERCTAFLQEAKHCAWMQIVEKMCGQIWKDWIQSIKGMLPNENCKKFFEDQIKKAEKLMKTIEEAEKTNQGKEGRYRSLFPSSANNNTLFAQ